VDAPGFAKAADLDEIKRHDFILTPGRYVGAEDAEVDDEPASEKIARLTSELYAEFERGRELESVVRSRLENLSP
jgi:type I restriction enzyme M protein